MSTTIRCLLLTLCTALLAACAPHKPFHVGQPCLSQTSNVHKAKYDLCFVEYDDQGELWDHGQLSKVESHIRNANAKSPILLLIFAHGWNNTVEAEQASSGNIVFKHGSAAQFTNVLSTLADYYEGLPSAKRRKVIGVCIGWRGRTGLNTLDFYDRMQTGQRVSGVGATECIYRLTAAARQGVHKSKIAIVGHSFGAIIVENALNKPLVADLARSREVVPPADLIMLVNQAQTSIIPRSMVTALKAQDVSYGEDRRSSEKPSNLSIPMIISLTSKADTATNFWFPFGISTGRKLLAIASVSGRYRGDNGLDHYHEQWLSEKTGTRRYELNQKESHKHTAGHNYELHSHRVAISERERENTMTLLDVFNHNARTSVHRKSEDVPFLANIGGKTYECSVERLPSSPFNSTPYWIIKCEKQFIKDHNDIWNEGVQSLVAALLNLRPDTRDKGLTPTLKTHRLE